MAHQSPESSAPPQPKTWLGAFAHPAFALVWTASMIALVGIAMYDTASGWLMTQLDLNPFAVSLVHAATNLPMFLFTLPAGAIADIVDPRRLILAVSGAIAALTALFAALVSFDLATPHLLLLTTFLLSAAWVLNLPAWLSIVPVLVPKTDLLEAIAANGVAYNLSRTLGPALGGIAIANFGMSAPFWAFAAANLAVVAALLWVRTPIRGTAALPAERLMSAVRTGVRHAANNRLLRATLARTLAVYPFAAAYWGLLPLIARRSAPGAENYGMLLSAISAGAIFASFGQRRLRDWIDLDWVVVLGTVGTAAALGLFAWSSDFGVDLAACFCAGAASVVVLTSLYASAQNVLPDWVRGRGLAVFLTAVFGATTVGSAAWGQIAGRVGLEQALALAAVGILVAIPLSWPWRLQRGETVDLSPSMHWRRPQAAEAIADDRGPVFVKIEYRIDPKDRERFLRAMDELGYERKRDGALAWGVFEDMGEFGRFEEAYLIESWLGLMHLRERVTNEDRMLEDEISKMLTGSPRIEFLVAVEREPLRRRWREAAMGA
jgi:predicted MFS family arabinose efflux permease